MYRLPLRLYCLIASQVKVEIYYIKKSSCTPGIRFPVTFGSPTALPALPAIGRWEYLSLGSALSGL